MHLNNKPDRLTIIFINGKCRMGQNLNKTHILAVIETSATTKTDTLAQGLMGRMAGYDVPDGGIKIYIHQSILSSGEIETHLNMMKGRMTVPSKGQNIKRGQKTTSTSLGLYSIRVIKVESKYIPSREQSKDFKVIVLDIITAIRNGNMTNPNDDGQTREFIENIMSPEYKIVNHNLCSKNKTYETMPNKLFVSITTETPFKSTKGGCGYGTNSGKQINVWTMKENYPEFGLCKGDVYITGMTRTPPENNESIQTQILKLPKVSGKEIFGRAIKGPRILLNNIEPTITLNLDTKLEVDTPPELVSVDTTHESNDIPQIFFTESFVGGCLIV